MFYVFEFVMVVVGDVFMYYVRDFEVCVCDDDVGFVVIVCFEGVFFVDVLVIVCCVFDVFVMLLFGEIFGVI